MQFGVVTLMPDLMQAFLDAGVIGRAVRNGSISVQLENPRDYTSDAHRSVDDRPFGGGPGMVMKAEPLIQAIDVAARTMPDAPVVYLSPQGAALQQRQVRHWQTHGSLILVAGRYEGIDERVITERIDAEVSIGDYVLSGGEIPAMAVIDAVSRLVPGVLGHPDSASQDSFGDDGLLDCPHYTRPEQFGQLGVPQVLLSGDHRAIAEWRRKMALTRTWERRPELLETAALGPSDKQVLKQLESAPESARTPGRSVADKQGRE